MAEIIYTYKDSVYANITNKCNCRCTFCIRFVKNGVGNAETLWHQENPTKEEVLDAIKNFDFSGYKELVFCGYGEPTCQLDILIDAAKYAKKEKGLKIRLNTNGQGSAENGRDIVPELAKVIDSVSVSLNAPSKKEYEEVTRPLFKDGFENMISFTKRCRETIGDVRWSIVDVLPEEEKDRCIALSKEHDIPLRIRKYSSNS
ncbi:TatD family nuclease-associated radical SAM protein [Butyrivibrio sp. JL13D10]|uniref:TatD family nuclease-associated radical SAM protein n=1 Tax=Butyrivibrio sp. JL13D10 TaxID=3236815 RepID=UPI0038B5AB12